MNTDYSVLNGKIFSNNGLPVAPRIFCDGHVAFEADDNGLGDIAFFAPKTNGRFLAFHKQFWGGMRFYATKENSRYLIKPKKCEVLPFGYRSTSDNCEFSAFVADDSIFFCIKPFEEFSFQLEFYHDYPFYPSGEKHGDFRFMGKPRSWDEFEFKDNMLLGKYNEQNTDIFVTFSSNQKLSYRVTPLNPKHILSIENLLPNENNVICLAFSHDERKGFPDYEQLIKDQFARYEKIAERAPVLQSKHPLLNQFFSLAPMYHDALKVNTVKGAIRAQTTRYWVWGWDSITSSNPYFYWGDEAFAEDMLDFMMKYSDEEKGLAHGYDRQMNCQCVAPPSAQGMYIVMLDYFRLSGGDFCKFYGFAKKLFKTILDTVDENSGLCKGMSLYPDFRELIKETGNDASAFNNTVCYCSARAMQNLAKSMGDEEEYKIAQNLADGIQKVFPHFFNETTGFFDSSIDATNCTQRFIPSNNAIKWENDFCADLVMDKAKECLEFYEKHLINNAGIRPMPIWSDCYDADANQLNCWWPVMSEFFIRICNHLDRNDLIDRYIKWVEYWSVRLMCPEGIPCYDDGGEVPFDNWNCYCGIWHAYSVRGFYNAILHGYVGVDIDLNGINFYAYSGDEVAVNGLNFGSKRFNIAMKGSGSKIKNVILNGKDLGPVHTIDFELLRENNDITVNRTK